MQLLTLTKNRLTKVKDVMIVVMFIAFANFLSGSIMGPSSDIEKARGFIGYSGMPFINLKEKIDCENVFFNIAQLLKDNWGSAYAITDGQMQNFISVFSVYFPACIGILAGANVSGELKVPNLTIFIYILK